LGPRSTSLSNGRLVSVLAIAFADESAWTFDIPKIDQKGARDVAGALAPPRP
jgi:hypothetical protein